MHMNYTPRAVMNQAAVEMLMIDYTIRPACSVKRSDGGISAIAATDGEKRTAVQASLWVKKGFSPNS